MLESLGPRTTRGRANGKLEAVLKVRASGRCSYACISSQYHSSGSHLVAYAHYAESVSWFRLSLNPRAAA